MEQLVQELTKACQQLQPQQSGAPVGAPNINWPRTLAQDAAALLPVVRSGDGVKIRHAIGNFATKLRLARDFKAVSATDFANLDHQVKMLLQEVNQ